ncbi:anti-sigma factor [Microbacterium koreense]|uniref:Anti-sigma factor n=1 Tax=Microbacterium koreense TaxID=323761 RepID=A0ABW2ZRN5_9MICO
MSHLDQDRFALIAFGEEPTSDETTHLDACDECALELAELEHTVSVGRSTATVGELEAPPERVWERIVADVSAARAAEETVATVPARSRTVSRVLFGLAASLVVVLGIAGVWNLVRAPQVVELASATLDAFPEHPGSLGHATVIESPEGEVEVLVALDADAADVGYREVWLIRSDASALISLGVLEGSEGVFPVPADIDIREYVLVDISQEDDDGDPSHSGDSIVRGELDFV